MTSIVRNANNVLEVYWNNYIMKKKVVLVLLDACRGDYISEGNTPFLANAVERGRYYKSLIPSYGFCERTEILVGLDAKESGCFTAFGYNPGKSPYRNFRYIFRFLGLVETSIKSVFLSKVLRRLIWEIFSFKKDAFYPARIPLRYVPDFALTEDGILNHIEGHGQSVYQKCKNPYLGATTSLSSFISGTDQDRLDSVLNAIDQDYDFYPTYISVLDSVGHVYGPESEQMKEALSTADAQLQSFYEKLRLSKDSPTLVICGDHGMSPVLHKVDIEKVVHEFKKEENLSDEISIFLDSTMARFWCDFEITQIENLKKAITDLYGNLGYFVEKENYALEGIPDSRMYGDLIWLCREGVVISPDYFTQADKNILGMHGYRPNDTQHYGFCLISDNEIDSQRMNEPVPLTTVYQELIQYFP